MTNHIAITRFDFAKQPLDVDALVAAWLPEIEAAAETYVTDDRFIAFLIAALRLGAHSKSLQNLNILEIVKKAGYSRSTFFRLFEGHTGFLLKGYRLTCALSTKVYEKHLNAEARSLSDFCTFTTDVFFGANCTMPKELVQMLWREHQATHKTFHPHIKNLTHVMHDYLTTNAETMHLSITFQDLEALVKDLDLIILNARLENDIHWGTPFYYKKLRRLMMGYLLACD